MKTKSKYYLLEGVLSKLYHGSIPTAAGTGLNPGTCEG